MNENAFKEYVYKNICQCPEQCLPDKYNIVNQSNCKEILAFSNIKDPAFYDEKINQVLQYFISSDILIKVGKKYYITTNFIKLKLTWENIKTLNNNSLKKLLWLFRKCIVDLLLKKILVQLELYKNSNFKIYSVGSNNLSSDYDITLYGDTQDKGNVLTLFEKEFKKLFYEDSSVVFDTNVYGKSFISFQKGEFAREFVCNNNQPIYILDKSSNNSQLVWALVKYFQDIRNSLGESMFNKMYQFLISNIKIPHISYAFETRVYLNNKDSEFITYNNLFSKTFEEGFIKAYNSKNKLNKLQSTNDYISLVNFYGNETYFTRGAFLDTVINQQMCKNKIELDEIDYISSILENSGFFFLHNNKTKYFIRVVNTLDSLLKSDKYKKIIFSSEYAEIKKILDNIKTIDEKDISKISYDDKYCNWINEKTFDLLKCEKYTIFNLLLKINYQILKIYSFFYINYEKSYFDENDIFPFYNYFVKKDTSILGKEISPKFSKKIPAKPSSDKKVEIPNIIIKKSSDDISPRSSIFSKLSLPKIDHKNKLLIKKN